MSVTALRCGSQAGNEFCSDFSQDAFKRYRGQVMTFIENGEKRDVANIF
jgi:hypothetical protein